MHSRFSLLLPDTDGSGLMGEATDKQVDGSPRSQLGGTGDGTIEDDAFRRVHKEKDFIVLLSCTASEFVSLVW